MKNQSSLKKTILAALFAALTAIGSYIAIPLGPVPIVLANLFPFMAGLLLGPLWGGISMLVYLLTGIIGLPVFSGGGSGLAQIMGPTGGFLLGYALAAVGTGLISHLGKPRLYKDILAVISGVTLIYLCGIPLLQRALDKDLLTTIKIGMLPFLMGDALKAAGALVLARIIRKQVFADEQ